MDKKDYLKQIDSVIAAGSYSDTWESLCSHPDPEWYRKAKFGIFIHWGVYSVPAFSSEWYPRMMYLKGTPEYEHHLKTYGSHDKFGYKDFIKDFTAEKFNAAEWMDLFAESGAKYVMPVAEHHDGFKLYNSDINKWNSVEMGPKRDIVGELKAEAEKRGIKICGSNHRAEHFWFFDGGLEYPSDVSSGEYDSFYGPPHKGPQDHSDLFDCPPTEEHMQDWLVTNCEFVDKYHPYVVWYDWWIQNIAWKPYLRKFAAYYYNRAEEWGMEVAINSKFDSYLPQSSVFDIERGQEDEIKPKLWQNDTAIAKNSWGYTHNNDFKTAGDIIADLVDIVSKNGVLLLNIGPKPDGTITAEETAVLKDIGAWLKVNGEGIYDTSYFNVCGEGPTKIPKGSFTDIDRAPFTSEDIRFTYKDGCIYMFVMKFPKSRSVKAVTLGRKAENLRTQIKSASVLGSDSRVSFRLSDDFCEFNIAKEIDTNYPICIKLELA